MEYQLITSDIASDIPLSPVEQVLINRGFTLEDIPHYLCTTDDDILNTNLLDNMREGAEMLISHIAANDKILIQVDSDCDGYGSAALLINYLHCLFPAFVENNISYRIHEGKEHGIILDTVPDDVSLVIAPDGSSNDYEVHKQLKEKNIDVLVLDHHEAERVSEYACVINNQLCDYPNKTLSGAGIVYKFCCYLDELMGTEHAENFLDLTALCLIADMVDLKHFETRHLITLGLNQIRNPYFYAMIKKNEYQLKGSVTPFGVSFYISPYINATVRMGTHAEKMLLFESMLNFKAYESIPSTKRGCKGQMETRVEQACRNSTNIKNRQTKARDAEAIIIEQLIEKNNLADNKILIVQLPTDHYVEKTLTGLIANQLASIYQRPALVLNKTIYEHDGQQIAAWEGSGRGYKEFKIADTRQFLNNSNLVLYAEGHANAFGVGVADEDINTLIDYINEELKDLQCRPNYKVDFIFNSSNFNGNDILEIAHLKHLWGQGVEEPYVIIENLKVTKDNLHLMAADRSPTLKIELDNGTSLIKFKSSQEEYDELCAANKGCFIITALGRCAENIWNDNVYPQLILEDYEITNEVKYYF